MIDKLSSLNTDPINVLHTMANRTFPQCQCRLVVTVFILGDAGLVCVMDGSVRLSRVNKLGCMEAG